MNIVILGAAGFIGTNLAMHLSTKYNNIVTLVDEKKEYFAQMPEMKNAKEVYVKFNEDTNFDHLFEGQDIVYHLISTNNPTTSNKNISKDLTDNVTISINLLEACVRNKIKKVVFISSGGTVYGPDVSMPINESSDTNPINTYGIQKLTIEKLLYLYGYMHGLDYRIVRLSNPYGPYQRPNGKLGVVSTFIYKALKGEKITVYGDGTVVRDYIYIDDAIKGIELIANSETEEKIFNLGSGKGTSVNEIIEIITKVLKLRVDVEYIEKRSVDVPINVLDISRVEKLYGRDIKIKSLEEGMEKTKDFFVEKELYRK